MKAQNNLTVVIKLGTSSIVDEKTHEPILSILSLIVETAVKLRKDGHRVVLVSSGAIGVGLRRMGIEKKPKHLPRIQALAAVGQCRLMSLWDSLFAHLQQPVAQILLTRNDIADRTQYLNAQNTISELLSMGVIPIVNENDTIAVTEIKFGDNDTLSAIAAAMVQADYLFLMTDVDCLYTSNPRTNPDAQPIYVVYDPSTLKADVSSPGSSLGTGGMSTKVVAARLATSAGVTTVITRSSKPGNVVDIINYVQCLRQRSLSVDSSSGGELPQAQRQREVETPNMAGNGKEANTLIPGDHIDPGDPREDEEWMSYDSDGARDMAKQLGYDATTDTSPSTPADDFPKPPLHTRFLPSDHPIRDRSFWLLHGLAPHGTIYIDEGASRALCNRAGLLPVGIFDVEGGFSQQEAVRIVVGKRPQTSTTGPESISSVPSPTVSGANSGSATPRSSTKQIGDGDGHEKSDVAEMEIGRALVNYSATEIKRIMGLRSSEIEGILGYADSEYVALRENISLSKKGARGSFTPTMIRGGPRIG